MLQIKCGKPGKKKGVLIHPIPMPRNDENRSKTAGAATCLKDVCKKHESAKKQNITTQKDT